MNWAAAATLSFMTFCIERRLTILPDPFVACISKCRRQPRSSPMTAKPITSPIRGVLGNVTFCCLSLSSSLGVIVLPD